jgi:hypothetical protein
MIDAALSPNIEVAADRAWALPVSPEPGVSV